MRSLRRKMSGKNASVTKSLLGRAIEALWAEPSAAKRHHRRAEVVALEPRVFLTTAPAGIPQLDSYPSARDKIYIDFAGTTTSTTWGAHTVPPTPAYDIDG